MHPLKPREINRPAVERGNRINTDAVETVRAGLVERNHVRMGFDHFQKEIFVTHAGKAIALFRL